MFYAADVLRNHKWVGCVVDDTSRAEGSARERDDDLQRPQCARGERHEDAIVEEHQDSVNP